MAKFNDQSVIDLSRIPPPDIIETVDFEVIRDRYWDDVVSEDPQLASARELEQSFINRILGVQAYGEMIVRSRVNASARAVLAPLAKGADLDNIAIRVGIERLVLVPADGFTPAVMESDESLLRRYMLAFDRPSAGSADGYLYDALTSWPGMGDARVNGHAVHGRRGDTDIVIIGPGGVLPTAEQMTLVTNAVLARKPEAVSVAVVPAKRKEYAVDLVIEIPRGPDPSLVRAEAVKRIEAVRNERTLIGGEIPEDLISGAGYGPNIIKVRDLAPVLIEPEPYTVPVCTDIQVAVEVRT